MKFLRILITASASLALTGWIALLLGGKLARAQESLKVASAAEAAGRVCPTCKHTFPAGDRFCPVDGVPLAESDAVRPDARVCPRCKRRFASSARFCSHDGAPLVNDAPEPPASKHAATADPAKSTRPPTAAGAASATTSTAPATSANETGPTPEGLRLSGSAYVSGLRAALLATDGDARADWDARLNDLAERFRLDRCIVLSVQFEASEPELRAVAAALEAAVTEQLRAVAVRDVEIVPAQTVASAIAWKRVQLKGRIARAESARQINVSLALGECGDEPAPLSDDRTLELLQSAAAPVANGPAILAEAERIVQDAARWLAQRRAEQFADGRRFARQGQKSRAVEEYLRFLFTTADFATPQAEQANQFVVEALKFSPLDWLWGEPDVAVVRGGSPTRRLPLGFRAAPGDASANAGSRALPHTIVSLADGVEMVLVPGGTERMGNDSGPANERPSHAVTLGSFYIDRLETSVAAYARFVAATGHRVPQADDVSEPSQWERRRARAGAVQLPVVHVSWHDAVVYAQWSGKSLPSEAQWERAARGSFAADYPRSRDAQFARHVNAGRGRNGSFPLPLTSIFSFPATLSPFGCQNMLGNVAEWCRDWFDPDYYAGSPTDEPLGPGSGELRVVRGGSWRTPANDLSPSRRDALAPTARVGTVGFRCVLNLPAGN